MATTLSGKVYNDYSANSIIDPSDARGLDGGPVTVTAYGPDGTLCGTTTATAATVPAAAALPAPDNWTITPSGSVGCSTGPWRIEFSNLPTGYLPSGGATNSAGGATQFVAAGLPKTGINFGAHRPDEFCQAEPELCGVVYRRSSVTNAANYYSFMRFPYASGVDNNFDAAATVGLSDSPAVASNNPLTKNLAQNVMGSTWGVAYRRTGGRIFVSSYVKANVALSTAPSGAGANWAATGQVWLVDRATNVASRYVNLDEVLGANTTQDTASPPKPAYVSGSTDPAEIERAYTKVGKVGLAGTKIIEDPANSANDRLFVVNLYDRKIYRIDASKAAGALTAADIQSVEVPGVTGGLFGGYATNTDGKGCDANDVRPFGLGVFKGELYVGLVCSAQNYSLNNPSNPSDIRSKLRAYVYKVSTPLSGPMTFSAAPVVDYPLNYDRLYAHIRTTTDATSSNWMPWTDKWEISGATATWTNINTGVVDYTACAPANSTGVQIATVGFTNSVQPCPGLLGRPQANSLVYPSPMLAEIVFDGVGNMVLGMRDRFSDQMSALRETRAFGSPLALRRNNDPFPGVGSDLPPTGGISELTVYAAGDTLNASRTGASTWSATLNSDFYKTRYGSLAQGVGHTDTSTGGMVQVPGRGDVVLAAYDVNGYVGTQGSQIGYDCRWTDYDNMGFLWLNNATGAKERIYRVGDNQGTVEECNSGDAVTVDMATRFATGTTEVGRNVSGLSLDGRTVSAEEIAFGRGIAGKQNALGDLDALCDASPIEIGNRVWIDANGNGVQDAGEVNIPGVAVELWADTDNDNVVDTQVGVAVTAADGTYYFGGIGNINMLLKGAVSVPPVLSDFYSVNPATKYEVRITTTNATPLAPVTVGNGTAAGTITSQTASNAAVLTPYKLTTPNAADAAAARAADTTNNATTDHFDSDASLGSGAAVGGGNSAGVAVISYTTGAAGNNNHTLDFGFVPQYSLGNRVWFDTNNDGILNNSEAGVGGVLVHLTNTSGVQLYLTPSGTVTTTPAAGDTRLTVLTDGSGYYRFDGLPAGDYRVKIDATNWSGLGLNTWPVGAIAGSTTTISGFSAPLAGTASSTPGASGVTGTTSGTGSTNDNDKGVNPSLVTDYPVAGVSSGTVTLGSGNQPTISDVAGLVTPASATNAGAVSPSGDAADNLAVDFGFFRLSVGNTVWLDAGTGGGTANNGLLDGTEAGIAGVRVELYEAGVLVAVTYTDSAGQYSFDQRNVTAADPTGAAITSLATANSAKTGVPLQPATNYSVRIPANQVVLAGLQSSADTAATPGTPLGADQDDSVTGTTASTSNLDSATFQLTAYAQGAGTNGTTSTNSNGLTSQPRVDFGLYAPPAAATITVTKAYVGDTAQITTQPSITVTMTCSVSGAKTVTFTPPATGSITGLVAGETCGTFGETLSGHVLSGGYTLSGPTSFTPASSLTTVAGSNALTVTNTIVAPTSFSLGNRVWYDTNNNGILDAGEQPIGGVKVQLLDSAGAPIVGQTVLTDANGYYRFDGLAAGTYAVQITPDNWTGLSGNLPQGTTAGPSTAATGAPLAGYQSSTVGTNGVTGVTTGTGSTNNNDKGINPATAAAYTVSGVSSNPITLGPSNQPTVTDVDSGAVGAGAVSPSGDAADNLTVDFGFFRLSVGNNVWNDNGTGGGTANNGVKDGTEPGIANVTVQLLDGSGNVVAQTVTDGSGNYSFNQRTSTPAVGTAGVGTGVPLEPGVNYTVRIPANQATLVGMQSSADTGAAPGTPLSADLDDSVTGTATSTSNLDSSVFQLTAYAQGAGTNGTTSTNSDGVTSQPRVDFGLWSATYALGNRVWYDTNNNGILDAGEQPVAGVRVQLLDNAGAPIAGQTVLTDANGYYRFDTLNAGTYSVQVTPDNWTGISGSYPVGTTGSALVVVSGSTPLAGYLSSTPTDTA
ncbi:MAG: carboxypeptidase regulatory-like domain-containing protein, partial [Burkholderiales bacterium]|nr:carboxypeptidase regulatory-like domain-containing protein [Burkholderiales bacterium]